MCCIYISVAMENTNKSEWMSKGYMTQKGDVWAETRWDRLIQLITVYISVVRVPDECKTLNKSWSVSNYSVVGLCTASRVDVFAELEIIFQTRLFFSSILLDNARIKAFNIVFIYISRATPEEYLNHLVPLFANLFSCNNSTIKLCKDGTMNAEHIIMISNTY